MKVFDPEDEAQLARLLERQRSMAFDLERSIHWGRGVDLSKPFVPLDPEAFMFPEADAEQRLALSQYMGLVIARTFGEMESALVEAKDRIFARTLRRVPLNPEFEALGQQFFDEEAKHSRMFRRYLERFADATGCTPKELDRLLPSVSGTLLHRALELNSELGGHALWYVLALVEEVSISIYRQLQPFRGEIDPLYYEIHRRHFEEEVRHSPYSYWMIEHLHRHDASLANMVFRRADPLVAQALEIEWTLTALGRILNARRLASRHPFYARLWSCVPLLLRRSPLKVLRRLFVSAPFISMLLNPRHSPDYEALLRKLGAPRFPMPAPAPAPLSPR